MKREVLASAFALVMWFGGCPKRQAPTHIVYVPAPPPPAQTAQAANEPAQTLVIEEPAEPAPEPQMQVEEPPVTPPQTKPKHYRPPLRTEAHQPETESETQAIEPPATEVPALEPRESSAQESTLRRQVKSLQDDVRQKLVRLGSASVSSNNRKVLDDARTFLAQSTKALTDGDLQRALLLGQKSQQLVNAVEQAK